MNTPFPAWNELKRYFFRWRKRALIRREQRMFSDHQCWDDITPPTAC
jgi:hypothetical protein